MQKFVISLGICLIFGTLTSCTTGKNGGEESRKPAAVLPQVTEEIDTELGEEYEPNEDVAIQKVIDEAMIALKRDFKPPNIPRDAHAKSHGCLTASFEVDNKNLPESLRLGIFAKNRSYPAWVRFSNNTSDPMSHDRDLDLRGIAIKVMEVDGKKLMSREENERTQDFLMFASPIFFVKDIKDYAEFIKALGNGEAFKDLTGRPRSLVQLATAQLKARNKLNPLKLNYFSAVPFRIGERDNPNRRAAKFSAKPCDPQKAKLEPSGDPKDRNFMRNALKKSMAKGDACYQFQVQIGDPERQDLYTIEDPSNFWPEKKSLLNKTFSPYKTVAYLRIPKQDFDNEETNKFCERLSYTPWHSLPAHRPLGRTNRMRLKLYEAISKYRHSANGVERIEPRTLDPKTAYK